MAQRTGKPLGDVAALLINHRWQDYNAASSIITPGAPLPVVAPIQEPVTWDFPSYFNMMALQDSGVEPTGDDNISFADLRSFSENFEMIRLVIETCKDQLTKLRWAFRLVPSEGMSPLDLKEKSEKDPRVKELNKFFEFPDKEHDFYQWLRMLLEEVLVCDVIAIYRRKTRGGQTYALNLIDCELIERKIDPMGLTPLPNATYPFNIAYQEKVKGSIVAEFTTNEMLYYIRNPRIQKVFGYSPMEQLVTTISTGIRLALFQLAHYTEGNVPAMFMRAPVEWTKEQIMDFQNYWNELMSGNLGKLAKGWMIPGDTDPVFPQKEVLKDDFDEWIARKACYAYSVSPNAFIKNLNRATSEQAREQADEEGMQMRMFFIQNLMNRLQKKWWGHEDIEFHMSYDRPQDSKKQADIDNIDIKTGLKSVDEVRRERGFAPIGAPNRVYTTNGYIPLTKGDKPGFDVFQQKIISDDPKDEGKPPATNED